MSINIKNHNNWAYFKRLAEQCFSQPELLERFLCEPEAVLTEMDCPLDPDEASEAVRMLLGQTGWKQNALAQQTRHVMEGMRQYTDEKADPERIAHPAFRAWMKRQRGRGMAESALSRKLIRGIYLPVCFELTEGCSGGCTFCCMDAPPLRQVFRYTPENAELWRAVLKECHRVAGGLLDLGVCYLGTEPLDNPDYESFLLDFRREAGSFPQTTTAAAVRDPERTRGLLKLLGPEELNKAALRFSVVSLEQQRKIYEIFQPEELCSVELLPNNPESSYGYSDSGRARRLKDTLPEKDFENLSSVCLAGFAINMCTRIVRLIAPYPPDEEHPSGVVEYESACFEDAVCLAERMNEMIKNWMPEQVAQDRPLRLNPRIRLAAAGGFMEFHGDKCRRLLRADKEVCLALQRLFQEKISLSKLCVGMAPALQEEIRLKLQDIYEWGYLELFWHNQWRP